MNCVIVFILWMVVTAAVHLRYRIRVKGLDEVVARYGRKGILFLPNHPALIDPVILNTVLWGRFKPRSLALAAASAFWRCRTWVFPALRATMRSSTRLTVVLTR